MNDKKIIEAAKIINESIGVAEHGQEALLETTVCIPTDKNGFNKLKALLVDGIRDNMSLLNGVKLHVRNKREGGYSDKPSKHACSVKLLKTTDDELIINIPRQSFLDIPKMMVNKKTLRKFKADGEAAMRFVYDCQAILIAIWDTTDSDELDTLYGMLRDKLVNMDYYKNNSIKGPKSQEQLDKDMEEVRKKLAADKHDF